MPTLSLFPSAVQGVEAFRDPRTGKEVQRVVDFDSELSRAEWLASAPAFHVRTLPPSSRACSRGPSTPSLF